MKKRFYLLLIPPLFSLFLIWTSSSIAAKGHIKPPLGKIHGRIQFVDSFPDFKVQQVSSFPDLRVQKVDAFPDAPGKWQIVDSFPDYKIQLVDSFPDFTVQFVDSFPGVKK